MAENKEINTIVDNVILAIDNKNKDEFVPQELLNYLYLSTIGLCISLGENYVDDLFNVINRVTLVNKLDYKTSDDYVVLSNFNSNFEIDYKFFIRNIEAGNVYTLEFIIKELLSLLCEVDLNMDTNDKFISEVLKNLEVEDTISTIINLREFDIKNDKFNEAFKCFREFNLDNYSAKGYEAIVNLFRPLYKFSTIKQLFVNNLIDGRYYNIYEEFDNILGSNAFLNMIDSLKTIRSSLMKKNIPTYKVACSYLNIRNKFIQNYINLKFNTI